jgi:5-methylcytosine-specific restriction protein A
MDRVVWEEFASDRERLGKVAQAIRQSYQVVEPSTPAEVEEEDGFPEGKVIYRLHRGHERNPELVRRAKEKAMDVAGRLACDACGFDFARVYGEVGRGFIECHHLTPLAELSAERISRLSDLALVCPNCHRMIHRKRPWLRLDQLSGLVQFPRPESGQGEAIQ